MKQAKEPKIRPNEPGGRANVFFRFLRYSYYVQVNFTFSSTTSTLHYRSGRNGFGFGFGFGLRYVTVAGVKRIAARVVTLAVTSHCRIYGSRCDPGRHFPLPYSSNLTQFFVKLGSY